MKFSEHIGKGAWAFASRGLPMLYAFALIAVARVIPKEEFGVLAVFQTFFTIIFSFSDSFALQAIVKFSVEPDINLSELLTVISGLFLVFLFACNAILLALAVPLSQLLRVPQLSHLFLLLAVLSFMSVPRVISSKILQSNFRMRELFWVDFGYFGVSGSLIFFMLLTHRVARAADVVTLMIIAAGSSSLLGIIFARRLLTWKTVWSSSMLRKISSFVKYQAATGIVSVAQQNFDTLLVSSFTGAAGAATYQGAKILYRGYDIVRDTTLLFIFPSSSKYHSRGEMDTLRRIVEKATGLLYWLLIPSSVLLFVFCPYIFHALWGGKYDDSIPIFRILSFASIALPLQIVFPVVLIGAGEVKKVFRILAITLPISLVLSLILLSIIGIAGAAIAFVLTIFFQAALYYRTLSKMLTLSTFSMISGSWHDSKNYLIHILRNRTLS